MNIGDIILPVLSFLLVVNSAIAIKKGLELKNILELIIGILILGFSIWNSFDNSETINNISIQNDTLRKQTIKLDSSLNRQTELIKSLGLKFDQKTGEIYIIDSQILKNILYQTKPVLIINNSATTSEAAEKLSKAFNNLANKDLTQKNISLNYIIANFPDSLTNEQINQLLANTSFYRNDQENEINYLLSKNKKSEQIKTYFKKLLQKRGHSQEAWEYLFRKDNNIDFSFVVSIIKNVGISNPIQYGNIVKYAMTANNPICKELLNSHELVNFSSEGPLLNETYNLIKRVIDSKSSYKMYRNTYFFEKVKPDS